MLETLQDFIWFLPCPCALTNWRNFDPQQRSISVLHIVVQGQLNAAAAIVDHAKQTGCGQGTPTRATEQQGSAMTRIDDGPSNHHQLREDKEDAIAPSLSPVVS